MTLDYYSNQYQSPIGAMIFKCPEEQQGNPVGPPFTAGLPNLAIHAKAPGPVDGSLEDPLKVGMVRLR